MQGPSVRPQFTFPVSPDQFFVERDVQFRTGWGVTEAKTKAVRRRITDMWQTGPGGWCYEWTVEAQAAARRRRWLPAAMSYGIAQFPCLNTPDRLDAQREQIACYMRASRLFPVRFDRHLLEVPYRNGTTTVPVHLFRRYDARRQPLLLLSGGSDTCKMDLHQMSVIATLLGGFTVAAMDMPGTGESTISLHDDVETVYEGVLTALQERESPTSVAALGVSFGGLWVTRLAMKRLVDAAVVLAPPVGTQESDSARLAALPNGMTGIICNALGFAAMPSPEEAADQFRRFSLIEHGRFDAECPVPILAINGTADPYIPSGDTTIFETLPNGRAWLVEGAYHIALEQLQRVMPPMIAWLRQHVHGPRSDRRAIFQLASLLLPKLQTNR